MILTTRIVDNILSLVKAYMEMLFVKSSFHRYKSEIQTKHLKENSKMLERVIEIIAEQLSVDAASITEETSFKDDLGADSLDLFELVMAFEEEYGVEIPSEDLEGLTTVASVIDYMKGKGVEA